MLRKIFKIRDSVRAGFKPALTARYLKVAIIMLFLIIIIFSLTRTPTKLVAKPTPFEKYADGKLTLSEASTLYHKTVNDIFNQRIKLLMDKLKNPQTVPEKSDAPCEDKSVRTYCLAMTVLDEYDGYIKALMERRKAYKDTVDVCNEEAYQKVEENLNKEYEKEIDKVMEMKKKKYEDHKKDLDLCKMNYSDEECEKELKEVEKESTVRPTAAEVSMDAHEKMERLNSFRNTGISAQMQMADSRTKFIDRELKVSSDTLDKAIAAYNELQIAYPIHRQYEELIKNLQEYNKALSKIRGDIESFPSKFQDASTPKCT